jgi:DNA-directed RNA polymerase subunit beta
VEKLEKVHVDNEKELLEILISKLQSLVKEKPSSGVTNNFGEMLIGKGAKFSAKNLSGIDYQNVNPLGWTGDAKIDEQINILLHNFNINVGTRMLQA